MTSVEQEIAAWRATASKSIHVVAATSQFLTLKYERTPYVKAKVTLNFPPDYPSSPVIATVEGLAPGLCKKLVKEMEDVAKAKCGVLFSQVQPVIHHLVDVLDTNRFVPCWKEVRKLVDMAKQSPQKLSVLSLQERKGTIRIKINAGAYFYDCKITVNPGYPSTITLDNPLQISLVKSNFPKVIAQDMITQQANGFVRFLQDGVIESEAWIQSNPIPMPATQPKTTAEGTGPTPSLLPLVSRLRSTIQKITTAPCPVCKKTAIPDKPAQLQKFYDLKGKHKNQPFYSSCGCWFHFSCLNQLLTEPPFGEACPACKRRAYHPDWTADTKELEKAYAERQARQREIDDVAMMF